MLFEFNITELSFETLEIIEFDDLFKYDFIDELSLKDANYDTIYESGSLISSINIFIFLLLFIYKLFCFYVSYYI